MYHLNLGEREWKGLSPIALAIAFFLSTILLALKFHPWFNLLLFLTCQLMVIKIGIPPKRWLTYFLFQVLMALAIFLTGYYYTSSTFDYTTSMVVSAPVWNGLQLSARALAFSGLGILFANIIDQVALIESSMQLIMVPRKYAYGILAAWGIFPKIKREYRAVGQAMKARGIKRAPFSPSVIRIMLVKAVRWSDNLALALISRGLTDDGPMEKWRIYRWHLIDFVFMIGMPILVYLTMNIWPL